MFDDANDFNDDDFSILDTLAKQEGKGNVTEEARAKKKGMKQGFIDDDEGYGGSYGYRGKFIFNRHCVTSPPDTVTNSHPLHRFYCYTSFLHEHVPERQKSQRPNGIAYTSQSVMKRSFHFFSLVKCANYFSSANCFNYTFHY